MPEWLFANIGFDTQKKLWMIEFFDELGQWPPFHVVLATDIFLDGGDGKQFEWHDPQGAHWHVRERIYRRDVERIDLIPVPRNPVFPFSDEAKVIITCKPGPTDAPTVDERWEKLRYAYDVNGDSRGFVEFLDADEQVVQRLPGRWIITESVPRRTVGTFPNIRLEVKRSDVSGIFVGESTIVICGRDGSHTYYINQSEEAGLAGPSSS